MNTLLSVGTRVTTPYGTGAIASNRADWHGTPGYIVQMDGGSRGYKFFMLEEVEEMKQ